MKKNLKTFGIHFVIMIFWYLSLMYLYANSKTETSLSMGLRIGFFGLVQLIVTIIVFLLILIRKKDKKAAFYSLLLNVGCVIICLLILAVIDTYLASSQ